MHEFTSRNTFFYILLFAGNSNIRPNSCKRMHEWPNCHGLHSHLWLKVRFEVKCPATWSLSLSWVFASRFSYFSFTQLISADGAVVKMRRHSLHRTYCYFNFCFNFYFNFYCNFTFMFTFTSSFTFTFNLTFTFNFYFYFYSAHLCRRCWRQNAMVQHAPPSPLTLTSSKSASRVTHNTSLWAQAKFS